MSGFLGFAAGIVSAFSLSPPITIGDIPLVDFAVPRRLGIGGRQKLDIAEIPGGQLAIQALGDFPEPFEIEGIFQGPSRDSTAQQFEVMRKAGIPVQLIGMGVSLTVVIEHFRRVYETGWISYRMALIIVPDPPAQQDLSGAGALGGAISGDISAGLSSISDAMGAIGNFAITSTTLQTAGLNVLATAQNIASSQIATAVQGIANLGLAGIGL